jgi:hypothetical protein
MHHFMTVQRDTFVWDDSEHGTWKEEFFPPVEIPTVEHKVWIERPIPIPWTAGRILQGDQEED